MLPELVAEPEFSALSFPCEGKAVACGHLVELDASFVGSHGCFFLSALMEDDDDECEEDACEDDDGCYDDGDIESGVFLTPCEVDHIEAFGQVVDGETVCFCYVPVDVLVLLVYAVGDVVGWHSF